MTVETCGYYKNTVNKAYSKSGSLSLGEGREHCEKCNLEVIVRNNIEGIPSEVVTIGKIEDNCISYTDSE